MRFSLSRLFGRGRRRGHGHLALLMAAMVLMLPLVRCGEPHALLLTVTATHLVETFDLRIKNLSTNTVVLERIGEQVDPENSNRDISKPGQELKIALEFAHSGRYLLYLLGRRGGGLEERQFFVGDYKVSGTHEQTIRLVPLAAASDQDQDGWAACGAEGFSCEQLACRWLDCDDTRPDVNPMALEICGNLLDDDCSGGCGGDPLAGDEPCIDADGDGEPAGQDCDDNDPCRSHRLAEGGQRCANCEGYRLPADFPQLPQACLDKLAAAGLTLEPPYCDDGIDHDCSGKDAVCIVDADCDCFAADADCNESDPTVNPDAQEICGDGVDNNCNELVDEGCLPCDIDGDGHARVGTSDPSCAEMPADDHDDYDAGKFPAADLVEGGNLVSALREFCSSAPSKDQDASGRQLLQREVDHNGDGVAAADEGCPDPACDGDGDGFMKASCSPPKSQEDCDDADPHTFPGAPDKCGDGSAQNCVSDGLCACDGDGDGYCPAPAGCQGAACLGFDCDDADPLIQPWALELCDRKDNDCDGLTDEGNPGVGGQPLQVRDPACNYDNDGVCSLDCTPGTTNCSAQGETLSGICVCSPYNVGSSLDAQNHEACAGEDLGASASPRCFNATAPASERCQQGDFDCSGQDIQPGQTFDDMGKPCGVSRSTCQTGSITSCDLSQTLPADQLSLIRGFQPDYNEHWVCSGDLPFPEVCNGQDDDCDEVVPGNELDGDSDSYIPCAGCTTTSSDPRLNLRQGLTGCNDCDSSRGSVYPGAEETCNNRDDDCDGSIADDGEDQCQAPLSCCSEQSACRNLSTDVNNCGGCGTAHRCDSAVADRCVNGACVCGTSGASCPAGLNCDASSGTCRCIAGGRCAGCCSGNTCLTSTSSSQCGVSGESCKDCRDGNSCTRDLCSASTGVCSNPSESSSVGCTAAGGVPGHCLNSQCCVGCIYNGQCLQNDPLHCAAGGATACATCPAGSCQVAVCNSGSCATISSENNVACSSGGESGRCLGGACCTGCLTGGLCLDDNVEHCGSGGTSSCSSCTAPVCQDPVCNDGLCATLNESNGGSCSLSGDFGRCLSGSCCVGCIEGGTCYVDSAAHCGDDGGSCSACAGSECKAATCNDGTCSIGADLPDGTTCQGTGECLDGVCCTGCVLGSSCLHTDPSRCGPSCQNCPAPTTACRVRACINDACGSTIAPDDTSCSGGICLDGQCCTGCIDSAAGQCYENQPDDDHCGVEGQSCSSCWGSDTCQFDGSCG